MTARLFSFVVPFWLSSNSLLIFGRKYPDAAINSQKKKNPKNPALPLHNTLLPVVFPSRYQTSETSLPSTNAMADNDDDSATVTFMNSQTGWIGNQAGWVGVKKLGQGGQGSAGLWVKRDPVTQKITDRLVVKETVLYDWDNWTVWGGKDNRIPSEVHTSQLMKKNFNTVWRSR